MMKTASVLPAAPPSTMPPKRQPADVVMCKWIVEKLVKLQIVKHGKKPQ